MSWSAPRESVEPIDVGRWVACLTRFARCKPGGESQKLAGTWGVIAMFAKLWNDESGIVAMEYLLLATIVGLGLIVGLGALEGALNAELTEVANAILGLSQAYTIETQSNCKAIKI